MPSPATTLKLLRKFRRNRRGSAAVEFALVLPVLMLLLFGIIDFGRMMNARITLSEAAHEGARAAAVAGDDAAVATIGKVMGSMASGMNTPTIDGCDGSFADEARVTLSYQFTFAAALFGDGMTMTATAVVPCL